MLDITTALTSGVGEITTMATTAAPIVLGGVVAVVGVNVGIKLFKKFINRVV